MATTSCLLAPAFLGKLVIPSGQLILVAKGAIGFPDLCFAYIKRLDVTRMMMVIGIEFE